ncbi:hypothetical protein LA03_21790 [Burkholderia gladioli]|nr:hypothetical protein LA03_21790 [Burkholderia gladioli]
MCRLLSGHEGDTQAKGFADRVQGVEGGIGLATLESCNEGFAQADQLGEFFLVEADCLANPARRRGDVRAFARQALGQGAAQFAQRFG